MKLAMSRGHDARPPAGLVQPRARVWVGTASPAACVTAAFASMAAVLDPPPDRLTRHLTARVDAVKRIEEASAIHPKRGKYLGRQVLLPTHRAAWVGGACGRVAKESVCGVGVLGARARGEYERRRDEVTE